MHISDLGGTNALIFKPIGFVLFSGISLQSMADLFKISIGVTEEDGDGVGDTLGAHFFCNVSNVFILGFREERGNDGNNDCVVVGIFSMAGAIFAFDIVGTFFDANDIFDFDIGIVCVLDTAICIQSLG